jgi:hypothetical protein
VKPTDFFVVERTGRIMVITNLAAPNKTVFLDLSTDTYSAYLEAGLLGLAFHPGYVTNRSFYVFRTAFATTAGATNLIHDVLSRFEASSSKIISRRQLCAMPSTRRHAGILQLGCAVPNAFVGRKHHGWSVALRRREVGGSNSKTG